MGGQRMAIDSRHKQRGDDVLDASQWAGRRREKERDRQERFLFKQPNQQEENK
jgi:hypothetical protein